MKAESSDRRNCDSLRMSFQMLLIGMPKMHKNTDRREGGQCIEPTYTHAWVDRK